MINKNAIYPTPPNSQEYYNMSPKATKTSKGKTLSKKRSSSRSLKHKKSYYKRKYKNKYSKKYFKKAYYGRAINVKADSEGYSKTKKAVKPTKQQKRIISNRFKNGYSPFIDRATDVIQLTEATEGAGNDLVSLVNKAKWIWRTNSNLNLIRKAFNSYPDASVAPATKLSDTIGDLYINSSEQSVYFDKIKNFYEILNPTNYDMNLVIYDIVYKEDTFKGLVENRYSENGYPKIENWDINGDDPIGLINEGLQAVTGSQVGAYPTTTADEGNLVATPTNLTLNSINTKPTDSYPFNIYCKIIKKHTFRLQPGATLQHKFVYQPKALINRGYLGYKYSRYLSNKKYSTTSTNVSTVLDAANKYSIEHSYKDNIAVKDFTCGCLFKFWGQVAGSGNDSQRSQVATLPGRLMLKETIETKWYAMDQRFNYVFNNENMWDAAENTNDIEVINNVVPHKQTEMNLDDTDNENPIPSTST